MEDELKSPVFRVNIIFRQEGPTFSVQIIALIEKRSIYVPLTEFFA